MNLLLNRDQTGSAIFSLIPLRIGSGVTFTLHAILELDEEEQALIKKYNIAKAVLVASDPIEDIKTSFRPALLLGLITFFIIWLISSFTTALTLGMLVTIAMTGVYFKTLREQIIVSELLEGGRKFRCDSVVDLIKKEAFLRNISANLRQVLESAKSWHDRELIPIVAMSKEEARLTVLKTSA